MIKRLLLAFAVFLFPSLAAAQCNGIFQPNTLCGNATGAPAVPKQTPNSVLTGVPGGITNQIQYNNAGVFGGFTMAGDCTEAIPNITCTKTNGMPFSASATTDTTNASNITSGTLSVNRFNSGTNANSGTWLNGAGTWTTPPAPNFINVLNNGVVADLKTGIDGVCNGTTTFTSASAGFTSAAVGKRITINNCGASGGSLVTTIAGFTNSTTITLSVAAGSSGSSEFFAWGTDNTSAVNTLLAASVGQTIYFPPGNYGFLGTINITQNSETILGAGAIVPNGISFNGSTTLTYLNADAANFLDIQSVRYITVRGLQITGIANGWTGWATAVRNSGTIDPTQIVFDSDSYGLPLNSHGMLLNTATQITIQNTAFDGGQTGMQGLISSAPSSYSNIIHMSGGRFSNQHATPIFQAGTLWSFDHVTFETLASGSLVVYSGTSGINATNISFTNCYMDDATVAGVVAISYYGNGFTFINNQLAGAGAGDTAIDLFGVKGFLISGNTFQSFGTLINYASATVQGGLLSGNAYHGVTTFEGNTANKDTTVINTGNIAF